MQKERLKLMTFKEGSNGAINCHLQINGLRWNDIQKGCKM
jgi:hypothetical protein